jgi:L-2,4-diaminobutyrate decarboxylase
MIDRTIELASFAAQVVSRDSSLDLVHGGSLSTVVFRYVPAGSGLDENEVNAAIRQRLFDRGIAVIGHTRVRGMQCLKFTFMNPSVSEGQIEELVGIVVECGRQLEQEGAPA